MVTDARGERLMLEQPAKRIVALAPHLAENLFSIGAGATLVGATQYSDFPPAAREIPRIGGFNTLSLERIVSLQPELVLAWGSGNSGQIINRLRELGIPVYVDEIQRLDDLRHSLLALGELVGAETGAANAVTQLTQTLDALRREPETTGARRVFYQIWHEPLQTIGGGHLISEMINHCGGQNIFADSRALAPRVSLETVLARDPQLIVISDEQPTDQAGRDQAGTGASLDPHTASPGGSAAQLKQWQRYATLSAVQRGALHSIHPDLLQRPTMRLLQGMQQLCALIQN